MDFSFFIKGVGKVVALCSLVKEIRVLAQNGRKRSNPEEKQRFLFTPYLRRAKWGYFATLLLISLKSMAENHAVISSFVKTC